MRLSLKALVSALALSVFASSANAEIYTEYTAGSYSAPGSMVTPNSSGLGLAINLAGLTTATIPTTSLLPGSFLVVDKNLDSNGDGSLYFDGGTLTLQDFSYNVSLGVLGSVVATGTGVQFTFSGGPIAVTNNNFNITNANTGALSIYNGSISLVGTVLGQAINASIDFTASPVTQDFSGLASPIPGYADINQAASDTDTDPHTQNSPGLTGVSNIDTDGAETFINYNGFSISTTIISGTLTLPTTITITGSTTVSVPEVSSVALIGASVLGLGVIARRRRSA